MRSLLISISFAAILGSSPVRAEDSPKKSDAEVISEISKRMDALYRADSSIGVMKMTVTTPNYSRELQMKIWTRGQEDTFVRIDAPKKEKGTATLKRGREMWNYLPKIKKTIRVPPSMMMSSWMGSDFTNDDIVRDSSWEDDYTSKLSKESPENQICIDYSAKEDAPVTYSLVKACVHATKHYPINQTFYDEDQRPVREMVFSDVKSLGGRSVPTKITLKPLRDDKKGNVTIIEYLDMKFNAKVKDSRFTVTSLRRSR